MDINEDFAMRLAKDRMADAMRAAERRRAVRLARGPRRPVRIRLGGALVRVGTWLIGTEPGAAAGMRVERERANC